MNKIVTLFKCSTNANKMFKEQEKIWKGTENKNKATYKLIQEVCRYPLE